MQNRQFRLAKRPFGLPTRDTWEQTTEEVREILEGEILVKINYISLDPAMRGWMNDAKSYIAPVGIGEVMRADTVGEVIASKNPHFAVGEYVNYAFGTQEYGICNGKGVRKIDVNLAELPIYLGALGMAGMTAYFGILNVGELKENETVVVSGAAGAVGLMVGQIAKIKNCKVIGIAGGEEKCKMVVEEFGFDACIDYKKVENLKKELHKIAPEGVDVYFDNVGGTILDDVLTQIRKKARIVICGAISQYNNTTPIVGPSNYLSLLVNSAKMEGFVIFDFLKDYAQGILQTAQWIKEGKIKTQTHIENGFENFPETLLMLFEGKNKGKLVLKVS
ncbi:MAG: NADP-dependent oxidoreductase [Bacteroidetes bacterium]|nr:MAG: NADP-dependent oxidoreductase [Bacteroidota bacterium]